MDSLSFFLEYSIVGIASGGVYALIALGIIVIFKSSRTFNFAMGEMMMLSAYMFYTAAVTFSMGILGGFVAAHPRFDRRGAHDRAVGPEADARAALHRGRNGDVRDRLHHPRCRRDDMGSERPADPRDPCPHSHHDRGSVHPRQNRAGLRNRGLHRRRRLYSTSGIRGPEWRCAPQRPTR